MSKSWDEAFEHFLSLSDVPDHGKKRSEANDKFSAYNRDNRTINEYIALESICTEIKACWLLHEYFSVSITGFDEHSPKATNPNNNCDLRISVQNEPLYIEVKRKCSDESQDVPPGVINIIEKANLGYSLGIETKPKKRFNLNPDEFLGIIEKHLSDCKEWMEKYVPAKHRVMKNYENDEMIVRFFQTDGFSSVVRHFTPSTIPDICSYLLVSGTIGQNGKEMIPMVKLAIEKGADYLMCMIPHWHNLDELIQYCFSSQNHVSKYEITVWDGRLDGLQGLILFDKKNEFRIIYNGKIKVNKIMMINSGR